MSGRIISYTLRKETFTKYQKASGELRKAQHIYTSSPTPNNRAKCREAKTTYDLWLDNYEKYKHSHMLKIP